MLHHGILLLWTTNYDGLSVNNFMINGGIVVLIITFLFSVLPSLNC